MKEKRLLNGIGEMDDFYIDEAELTDVAAIIAARKRKMKYGALAAATASGVAVTAWLIWSKRSSLKSA